MEDNIKACILTAYAPGTTRGENTGSSPYPAGQKRLLNSLVHHGFRHDVLAFQDWPNKLFDTSCGYNIKAAAFHEAVMAGYTRILWLDSSVWAIRNIDPIFDHINTHGWFFWKNGFNCAITCDDNALDFFQITRDQAEQMPDITTAIFGLHMENPTALEFYDRWRATAHDGMWATSRQHNNGSTDPRFQFDRQDQSCASVIANKLFMDACDPGVFTEIANNEGNYSDTTIFVMRGL